MQIGAQACLVNAFDKGPVDGEEGFPDFWPEVGALF
jgi:hypothetical protein